MITALIQQIIQNGTDILVYVIFSNNNNLVIYTFTMDDTTASISEKIQSDLDNMNASNFQLSNLQTLVGTQLQSTPNLTILTNNITSANNAVTAQPVITTTAPTL